jgi:YVTN family beta-propeller protein
MLVGLAPTAGALDPSGQFLFVSDSAAGRLLPIAVNTRHVQSPIPVGRQPDACQLDPSGELLLVANQDSSDVAVIRAPTGTLLTMLPVGARPTEITVLLF